MLTSMHQQIPGSELDDETKYFNERQSMPISSWWFQAAILTLSELSRTWPFSSLERVATEWSKQFSTAFVRNRAVQCR